MTTSGGNVIILTPHYSITGDVNLHNKRLSDVLNDKVETVVRLRNATVTYYRQGSKPPLKHPQAVVPKDRAVIVFEPPRQTPASSSGRLYGYVKKQAHDVLIIMHDIEVKGQMYMTGSFDILDIHRLIATSGDKFFPVTQAIVTLPGGRVFNKPDGILINGQHIDYLAKMVTETGRLAAQWAKELSERPQQNSEA